MSFKNPYAPPTSDLGNPGAQPERIELGADRAARLRFVWLVGFGLNMIMPLGIANGGGSLPGAGWVGLVAAAMLLAGVGFFGLTKRPAWTGPAVKGAFLVAASQVAPILQLIAGLTGVGIASTLTGQDGPIGGPQLKFGLVAAFVATFLTGTILIGFSLIAGLVIQACWNFFRPAGKSPGPT